MMKRIIFLLFIVIVKTSFAQDSSTVYFDFDKYELTAQAKQTLDKIVARPRLYSAVIYGHTDQFGSNEYNETLSMKRAAAVKEYLSSKGINESKIKIVKGFGETMPVINKLDEISRQANRRVVIITQYELVAKDSVVIEQKPKPIPQKIETPKTEAPKKNAAAPTSRKTIRENLITEITDSTTNVGDNIILKNINFYGGRHILLPESYPSLTELLFVMKTIPTLEIEIQGHICCQDGQGDGLDIDTGEPFLSYNRARSVYDYLVENGIDKKRMRYKGYGHKFPIIEFERTEAERTVNRRVEIKILKK